MDIREAVRRCIDEWNHSDIDLEEAIARALMAERERNRQDIENLLRAIHVRNEALERYENGGMVP